MVKNGPRDCICSKTYVLFLCNFQSQPWVWLDLQPGMITSDSESRHPKKNQRAVILLIAKTGKAERTKAGSSYYSRSKDLMEEELYSNLIPYNLLTGLSSNNLPLLIILWIFTFIFLLICKIYIFLDIQDIPWYWIGNLSHTLEMFLVMSGFLSVYHQILKVSRCHISKEDNRGY